MLFKGVTWNLVIAVSAVAIGAGFQHGFHTGVLNNPVNIVEDFVDSSLNTRRVKHSHRLVTFYYTLTVSIYMVGGMVGGCLINTISNHFGRKTGLYYTTFLLLIAAPMMTLAGFTDLVELLLVGRFLVGVMCGINCGLATMYLSEVSPVNLRGSTSTLFQLNIAISLVLSQVLGIRQVLGTTRDWKYLFMVPLFCGVCTNLMLFYCPESPQYLLNMKGEAYVAEARKALEWFRQGTEEQVRPELLNMMRQSELQRRRPKVGIRDLFKKESLRQPMIIALVLMMGQQFSGWVLFSHKIFQEYMGMTEHIASVMTIVLSTASLVLTAASLLVVDLAGRKTLLIISFSGLATTCLLLTLFESMIEIMDKTLLNIILSVLAIVFKAFYAVGVGPIPWFMVSELFDQSSRSAATSLAVLCNWFCNALISIIFPVISDSLSHFVFMLFFLINLIFALYVWYEVPETKQRTIDEIIMQISDDPRSTLLSRPTTPESRDQDSISWT